MSIALSGLVSLLSGSAFRMVWGEVAAYLTKRQDHAQELALLKAQADIAKDTHSQNLEALKMQHDLGIEKVYVQQEANTQAGAPPIRYDNDLRTFATELELQANNPVDYAYQLLQAGDEFTNATWNV